MRLLSTPLQLHDVRDTEALCRGLLDRVLASKGGWLDGDEYEDALSYLVATAWRLSTRYDRRLSTLSFSTYCSKILERRVVDWYRGRFGDSRYGNRPQPLSLEAVAASSGRSIADLVGASPYAEEEEVLTHVSIGR